MKKALVFAAFLLGAGLVMGADWGFLTPAPYVGPSPAGPLHSSRFFVTTAQVSGGRAEVAVPLTHPRGAFAVVLGEQPTAARVRGKMLPRREFFEPELESLELSPEGSRFDLSSLSAGEHKLVLEGLAKPGVQVVVAEPESPVVLELQVRPLAVRSGETVTVEARLADEGPVAEAQIFARMSSGGVVVLRDDGRAGDVTAKDGVFTGSFVAPEVSGMQAVELQVEARGRRGSGPGFARLASAAVMVTKPESGIAEKGVDVTPDALTLELLPAIGKFRLEVLYAASGRSFAWAQEEVELAGEAAQVRLPRPEATWGADKALVRVLNLDTMGVEAEVEVPLTPLAAPPDFAALAQKVSVLPASKAEAARRFGDNP